MNTPRVTSGSFSYEEETPDTILMNAESIFPDQDEYYGFGRYGLFGFYGRQITPEIAEKILKKFNHGNRKISPVVIDRYATAMEEGRWTLSQPLMFGENDQLIDGQHRLKAVIQADISVGFLVITGNPTDVGGNFDRCLKRNATHLAQIAGSTFVTDKHTGTVRYMLSYLKAITEITKDGKEKKAWQWQSVKIEPDKVVEFYNQWQDGVNFAVDSIKRPPTIKAEEYASIDLASILSVIAKAYYARPEKREHLREFCYCLNYRTTLKGTGDNAALALVEKIYLLKQKRGTTGGSHFSTELHSQCIWFTQIALDYFFNEINTSILEIPKYRKDKEAKDLFPLQK